MSKPKKRQSLRRELTSRLQQALGNNATRLMLEEIAPDLIDNLKKGMPTVKVADLLVKKVLALALDPKKSNQWAVELVFDRMEGKTAQGEQVKESGRVLEGRLDDITTQHLNSLAVEFGKEKSIAKSRASDDPPRRVPSRLEVSENETFDTEGQNCELDVASGVT